MKQHWLFIYDILKARENCLSTTCYSVKIVKLTKFVTNSGAVTCGDWGTLNTQYHIVCKSALA